MRRWLAALAMLVLAQVGCGQSSPSQPKTVRISGTVRLTSGLPAPYCTGDREHARHNIR